MATPLSSIVLRASDDPVKTDLEVVCEACDQVLCDAEHGDNLSTLASVAADHTCPGAHPEDDQADPRLVTSEAQWLAMPVGTMAVAQWSDDDDAADHHVIRVPSGGATSGGYSLCDEKAWAQVWSWGATLTVLHDPTGASPATEDPQVEVTGTMLNAAYAAEEAYMYAHPRHDGDCDERLTVVLRAALAHHPARLTQDGRAELVAAIRTLDTPAHGDAAWRAGLLAAARVVETTAIPGEPDAADLDSAVGRVREYLRQFARLRDTGGTIHDAFTDPEAESARLTANDLRVLLRAASPRGEDDEVTLRVAGGKAQITTTDDGDLRVYVTADKGSYAQCAVLPQSPGTVVLRLL